MLSNFFGEYNVQSGMGIPGVCFSNSEVHCRESEFLITQWGNAEINNQLLHVGPTYIAQTA